MQKSVRFWQLVLLVSMALAVLAMAQIEQRTEALLQIRFRYKWLFLMAFFAAAFLVQAWLLVKPGRLGSLLNREREQSQASVIKRIPGLVILLGCLPLIWAARFSPLGKLAPILGVTLFAVWWIMLLQSFGIQWLTGLSWEPAFLAVLIVDGLLFQGYTIFQPVTAYPFSVGWSEASRFYYGSLPFSRELYGQDLPLSFLHGSRYLMLSVPFLIPGLPLWADRLWQALLWLGVTALTSWLAVRRIPQAARWLRWVLGAWFFLFLFQGVVYYHLQVCVILILLGVWLPRKGWSLAAVIAASFWAGMSRVNWFPVPAMLAITIYLLEEPWENGASFWRYFSRPILWGITGLAAAFLGQAFYMAVSHSPDLSAFGSSFTSDLLWYRLLPNDTYAFGVIPGILLVSLPAGILLYERLHGQVRDFHPLRLLGLAAMLLILFTGGLIVSTKIGGGGDLHNMDAFLVMLALIVLYFAGQRAVPDQMPQNSKGLPSWSMLGILLLIPVGLAFLRVSPPIQYDKLEAEQDLNQLTETVQRYSRSGPVLFMYERHLLTFGMIPGIPLENDYEVVTLMEMAISGNQAYLDRFYHDIETHRFAAIVMRESNLEVNAGDFVEENNAWNQLVAYPLYCEYESVLALSSSNVHVYVPRAQRECPVP